MVQLFICFFNTIRKIFYSFVTWWWWWWGSATIFGAECAFGAGGAAVGTGTGDGVGVTILTGYPPQFLPQSRWAAVTGSSLIVNILFNGVSGKEIANPAAF